MVVAWVVAALLIGLVGFQTQHRLDTERQARLQHVEMMVANLSRLVQEHAANLLRTSTQTLRHIGRHYRQAGAAFNPDELVLQGELDGSIFRDIGVVDAHGNYHGGRTSRPATLSAALVADDFQRHRSRADSAPFVSPPYYDAAERRWAIRVTQRIDDGQGRFLGVALISLDIDYFNRFYDQIDVGATGFVALNGLDGIIRARRAAEQVAPGGSVALSPTLAALRAGQVAGFSTVASPVDGITRLLYFRRIPDFPLFVVVGFGRGEVLASLSADRAFAVRAFAVITALILLLALAFWRYHFLRLRSLRKSEELRLRMELAVDGADLGMWDWNIVERTIQCSPRLATMLGFRDSPLTLNQDTYGAMLRAEDRQELHRWLVSHLKGMTPYFDHEYPMTTHDGLHRWFLVRGKVVQKDADNRATRMLGTHLDITAKRVAEQDLRIAATAFEAQEGMLITDANKQILRVNRGFCMITGYEAAEVIGKTPSLLSSGRHDASFFSNLWQSVSSSGVWQGEIWNRRKNGEVYPEWLTITAVRDEKNNVTHYVGAFTDLTERKAAVDEIRRLAYYDPLTHLPNRRLMMDRLERALATANRTGRCLAVMFIDLDHFKQLNDERGHDHGDLLLQSVAQRLVGCVRDEDTVARHGGDEFLVLLTGLNEHPEAARHDALAVAQKMLSQLSLLHELGTYAHHCTASIGIALCSAGHSTPAELLKQADTAMYTAKQAGRNQIQVFDEPAPTP